MRVLFLPGGKGLIMEAVEFDALSEIAERVTQIVKGTDPLAVMIYVKDCHEQACPLRLSELAKADDFNLMHDIGGIFRHFDRNAGKLTDCFLPRYADYRGA